MLWDLHFNYPNCIFFKLIMEKSVINTIIRKYSDNFKEPMILYLIMNITYINYPFVRTKRCGNRGKECYAFIWQHMMNMYYNLLSTVHICS